MDRARLTREENVCGRGKRRLAWLLLAALTPAACGRDFASGFVHAGSGAEARSHAHANARTADPLSGATITVLSDGFHLDAVSAQSYPLSDLHVYAGSQLLFINADTTQHDILSDPLGLHNDCPELNTAGFLVPGQQRATTPLIVLRTCGFHDHDHEGDTRFGGKVTIESK